MLYSIIVNKTNKVDSSELEVRNFAKFTFEEKTTELYARVLEYQVLLANQYSRHPIPGYFRRVFRVDNWEDMLKIVQDLEESIVKNLNQIDGDRMKMIDGKISEQTQKLTMVMDLQMKLTAEIKARFLLGVYVLYLSFPVRQATAEPCRTRQISRDAASRRKCCFQVHWRSTRASMSPQHSSRYPCTG